MGHCPAQSLLLLFLHNSTLLVMWGRESASHVTNFCVLLSALLLFCRQCLCSLAAAVDVAHLELAG